MANGQRFAFRLALMLGERNPYAMMAAMEEDREGLYEEWMSFFTVEPFGPQVMNLMMARMCAASSGGSEDSFLPETVDGE